MKMRFEFPGSVAPLPPERGAAAVGTLNELPAVELAAIVYLRAWCAGGADRRKIDRDFRLVMGDDAGMTAAEDFDTLIGALLRHARRPFMRHGLGCKCFGGDESAFANMMAAAAGRNRDDALLFAGILVTGHAVWAIVQSADRLGQVFLRLADPSRMSIHTPEQNFHKH